MHKHSIVNMCYISTSTGVRKVPACDRHTDGRTYQHRAVSWLH